MTASGPAQVEASRPLQIRVPDDRQAVANYANHAMASFMGTEFLVTFAQILPPSAQDTEATQAILGSGSIDARVVTRLVMPADKFAEMAENFAKLATQLREQGLISTPKEQQAGRRKRR